MVEKAINITNDALYSYILIILLVAGGIYFPHPVCPVSAVGSAIQGRHRKIR